jgi:hypothetical protein
MGFFTFNDAYTKKLNFVALARKRIIPTERPPLVGEVSAIFWQYRGSRGQGNGSPAVNLDFLDP